MLKGTSFKFQTRRTTAVTAMAATKAISHNLHAGRSLAALQLCSAPGHFVAAAITSAIPASHNQPAAPNVSGGAERKASCEDAANETAPTSNARAEGVFVNCNCFRVARRAGR